MKDTKQRMSFLERHGADPALANAVLSAPAFTLLLVGFLVLAAGNVFRNL